MAGCLPQDSGKLRGRSASVGKKKSTSWQASWSLLKVSKMLVIWFGSPRSSAPCSRGGGWCPSSSSSSASERGKLRWGIFATERESLHIHPSVSNVNGTQKWSKNIERTFEHHRLLASSRNPFAIKSTSHTRSQLILLGACTCQCR